MTFEETCNAVRLYVEEKEFSAINNMGHWHWLERLDDCLADIRAELSLAAQDDDHWSRYVAMTGGGPEAAALIRSLRAEREVRVKPLEWETST